MLSFWNKPKVSGIGPSRLLIERSREVREVRFPIASGIRACNQHLERLRWTRLWPMSNNHSGIVELKSLCERSRILREVKFTRGKFRGSLWSLQKNKRNSTRLGSKFTASSQFSALLRSTTPKSSTFEEERQQIQLRFSAFKEKLFPLKFRTSKCERFPRLLGMVPRKLTLDRLRYFIYWREPIYIEAQV